MATEREGNWLGQQRVDVPHLRAIESGVRYDFDVLAGRALAGERALVASGFVPSFSPTPIGLPATSLTVLVAGSLLLHPLASESGTLHRVPDDRAAEVLSASNPRVKGSFTPSAVNFVGVDLLRSADDSTADLVKFADADTLLETAEDVPLARTLDYVFSVSTQDFSVRPTVAPLYKVTTDASGNVTALEDARQLLFRLGSGGSVPDAEHAFSWSAGRTEVGDNSDFSVGDKEIPSLKDWADAAMTRLWELGGGERWYSPTADRNVTMIRGFGGATPFTGGEYFEWSGTNLHWKGLAFLFDNSTGTTNQVADQSSDSPGLTDLADGQCVYVDLDRSQDRTGGSALVAAKATLGTLGTPAIPGSRYVMAWRSGTQIFTRGQYFPVGSAFAVASTTALGTVKLSVVSGTPLAPVVFNPDASGNLTRGTIGAGVLGLGGGANDTSVSIGKSGANTAIQGSESVAEGATFTSTTGGSAGVVTPPSGSDRDQWVNKDSAGNSRSKIDHNGYRMERVSYWTEEWVFNPGTINADQLPITNHGALNAKVNGGSMIVEAPMSAAPGLPTSHLKFQPGATANDYLGIATAVQVMPSILNAVGTPIHGFVSAVLEFEFAMDTVGANNADVYLGFSSSYNFPGGGGAENEVYFRKLHTDTNWQGAYSTTAGSGSTDTGVPPSANTVQKFRLELHGKDSPYGAKKRWFVDNMTTPVLDQGAPMPTANNPMLIAFYVFTPATAAAPNLWLSPIRFVVNRFLAA